MSWICPNCSNPNSDDIKECFVCGMERVCDFGKEPIEEEASEKIAFSDFEAFRLSIEQFFSRNKAKRESSEKIKKESSEEAVDRIIKKPKKAAKEKRKGMWKKSSLYTEPWPEHKIKFDYDAIGEKGFVRSEQKTMGGINGYYFYREDGSGQFIRVEMVLVQKMARKL